MPRRSMSNTSRFRVLPFKRVPFPFSNSNTTQQEHRKTTKEMCLACLLQNKVHKEPCYLCKNCQDHQAVQDYPCTIFHDIATVLNFKQEYYTAQLSSLQLTSLLQVKSKLYRQRYLRTNNFLQNNLQRFHNNKLILPWLALLATQLAGWLCCNQLANFIVLGSRKVLRLYSFGILVNEEFHPAKSGYLNYVTAVIFMGTSLQ